jgi:acyl-CoA synthetase (AMP-forming)/AMP-acid ligase II
MGFIAKDCGAKAVLTSRSYYWSVKLSLTRKDSVYAKPDKTMVSKLKWIMTDDFNAAEPAPFPESHSEILFLQYTSGSTSDPKGVMVTHDNIKQNCDHILDHTPIGVSWLPQYHDMGLIGYYLFFAIKGGTTYGFSPLDFMQRPALWLETISKYQATASSAPNFAFDYCLLPDKIPQSTLDKTDLRSLRVLMTAAEPVNAKTYQKFLNYFAPYGLKEESFSVAYGLAEFTLAVTNYGRSYLSVDAELLKQHKIKQVGANTTALFTDIMSCGKALGDTKIKIVSPSENKELKEGEVGEIWLNGTSKAQGYWGRNELSLESFSALLDHQNSGDSWLKTGDLGFLWNNELYVCGRLKDMIIIRGQNYYPQDIEHIIEQDSLVRKGCVAAFSIEKNGQELLVAVVGQKSAKSMIDVDFINKKTHQYFGIKVDVFVFVPARTVAKTSSGKIMRHLNKQRFINQELSIIQQVDCAHGVRIPRPK